MLSSKEASGSEISFLWILARNQLASKVVDKQLVDRVRWIKRVPLALTEENIGVRI